MIERIRDIQLLNMEMWIVFEATAEEQARIEPPHHPAQPGEIFRWAWIESNSSILIQRSRWECITGILSSCMLPQASDPAALGPNATIAASCSAGRDPPMGMDRIKVLHSFVGVAFTHHARLYSDFHHPCRIHPFIPECDLILLMYVYI